MLIKVIHYYNITTLKLFESLFVLNDHTSKYIKESVRHKLNESLN